MSPEKYLEKVIDLYRNSRIILNGHPNIIRGRSRSISSELEELTAKYLQRHEASQYNYYIDQPMLFPAKGKGGKRKTYYPDIVIEKSNIITDLVDTKADMGWNRNGLLDFCSKWEVIIENAKGIETSFYRGTDKKHLKSVFSKNLKYHVVIISNASANTILIEHSDEVNQRYNHVNSYILSGKSHPNSYGKEPDDIIKDMNIDYGEFERMRRIVK